MKVNLRGVRTLAIIHKLIISFVAISISASSANAQGICVPDTLSVTVVSGKVVSIFNDGEGPLTIASVTLIRGGNGGPVIAKQAVNKDGSFSFNKVQPGKYQLKVTAPALRDFYLDLKVNRSKATKDQEEIIIIMGMDFIKPCSGSSAELKVKKNS